MGAAPAQATVTLNGACTTDLTLGAGSTLTSCIGRYSGNMLNNANNSTINSALTALGYAGPAVTYSAVPLTNILSGLNSSTSVDFAGLLNGDVYFGVHYGNGANGPGNSTTFYRLNAANLDIITLNLNASSTATLFAAAAAVPEAGTWAMMVAGFGLAGAAMRRRRTRITFA